MADFRRIVLALAVLALCAGLASAQPMTCSSNAYPTQIRSEGVTELMGDIVLQCTGGVPTAITGFIPQANFVVYTNTTVTSRLLTSSGGTSEALLLVDDPGVPNEYIGSTTVPTYGSLQQVIPCQTPLTGCPAWAGQITYNGSPFTVPYAGSTGTVAAANEFFGIVSGNSVTFNGVPVLAPSSTGFTRYYRITNVRVNASVITGGTLPGSIIADVAVSGNALSVPNSALTTGYVAPSLKASLRNSADGSTLAQNILQCNTNNGVSTSTTTPVLFENLRFAELFAQAFKTRTAPNSQSASALQNVPGFNYLSESGFIPVGGGLTGGSYTPGLADFGTRLKAVFSNIPSGVNIYVSAATNNGSSTTSVVLVPSATYLYGTGTLVGLVPTTTTVGVPATSTTAYTTTTLGLVQLPVSNGSATAVWEVTSTATSSIENVDLPIAVQYTAAPSTNSPAIGTMTVNMEYAPTAADIGGTITAASNSQPIPRFVDTSTATNFFTVVQCTTSLLFPYVTEIAGFDTGIAIANTTTDPFSTPAQAGTCTLYWYGTAAPANTVTPSVASGTVYTTLTSLVAPGFSGYMIATCNFQYAHGFAFVSDLGARNLAMGYLALVMNQGSGVYRPIPTGEALEN
jgi:hypothetical protein